MNAMKSEVELLADMGVLGRIIPANVTDLSMESSMQRFVVPTD